MSSRACSHSRFLDLAVFRALCLQAKWTYKLGPTYGPSDIDSSPTVVNGNVIVGSEDGRLHALDATSGDAKWTYQTSRRALLFE